MANNNNIKKTIEDFLGKMGVPFEEVVILRDEGKKTAFIVKTGESGLLIGAKGENLSAINHLVKRIAGKNVSGEDAFDFYVDVNDYREKLMLEIRNRAQMLSERARSLKVNVELDPMTSYERMVIHTYFENVSDIETESIGVGRNRRVVIKYVGE